MKKPNRVPTIPSNHIDRQQLLFASILDGLRFACISPVYLTRTWLAEKFGFSDDGRLFSNSPYDYVQCWYLPLLRRGSTLPFFAVLDLGVSFVERDNIAYSEREPAGKEYRLLLERLIHSHESPANELIRKIRNDALRIQHYERQERVPVAQQRTRQVFSRLCFNAVPIFIESLLPRLDQILGPAKKYNLDGVRYSNFQWPLEGWDIDWLKVIRNPDDSLLEPLWSRYREIGMKDFNQEFFDALCHAGSQITDHKFPDVEKLLIGAACLEWPERFQLPETDQNNASGNKVNTPLYHPEEPLGEADLTLLSNYYRHHKLLFEDDRQDKRSFTKRTLASNNTKSRQPEGGFQEIGLQGQISHLLKSQLGVLDANPGLFYYKLYNHGLLYYMNTASRYRPMRMFVAVVVDMGPGTRNYVPELGYRNALARELAAYLIEDTCRYVAPLEGVTLDISIQLCRPDRLKSFFLRFTEEHARLLKTEDPFLFCLPEVFPFMFTLETAAIPAGQKAPSGQNISARPGMPGYLQDALDAIRRRVHKEAEVAFSEPGRRSSAVPYDCGHLAVITGNTENESDAPVFWRDFLENSRLLALARHSFLHQFALGDNEIEWAAGTSEKILKEPYRSMRKRLAVSSEASGSIRFGFVKQIIDEALRDRASFQA
jgi:hypothetical protein